MTCIKVQMADGSAGILTFPDVYKIRAGETIYFFEYHHFCGPTLLEADGWTPAPPPPEDHPFWPLLTAWIQHGRQVDGEGFAITEAL